ncbi:MAG: 1-acyl-sn-glycerol-3-phosphate acyltransferase [Acidimicrobiia bacterium]|nr:1-acyl-sn-glycerol-3-phosphate acyltransferase [Acidimicrobiia bacterium]
MSAPTSPTSRLLLRRAARAAGRVEQTIGRITAPGRNVGFPYRAPTVPRGVEVPVDAPTLGADYDTAWARSPGARAARAVIAEGPMRLAIRRLADPEVFGIDRLADLARQTDDDGNPPAVIFAPNHHSHLDTMLMVRAVPYMWRRRLVVAAAADYFFDVRWKATLAALSLNAVPIDRESTGRRSADMIREVVEDGWSLVIYPEGGRSPDGWGQDFKGGAAYVSGRTGAPVVPVFIDGTDSIYGKGMRWPRPGRTRVVFGAPLRPADGESTRRFNARIEASVTALADEATNDWWTARQRAASGTNPALAGPDYTGWRRQWALSERRRQGIAGWRRPPTRRWPDLD